MTKFETSANHQFDDPVDAIDPGVDLIPSPYGLLGVAEAWGGVATPVLAGFSASMIPLTLQLGETIRWYEAAVLLLTIAAMAFLGSLQAFQWARMYASTPTEALSWWQDGDTADRRQAVRSELRQDRARFTIWYRRAIFSYSLGVLSLLCGIGTTLIPATRASILRWCTIAVVAVALVIEVGWLITVWRHPKTKSRIGTQIARRLVP